jgi:hypothetical protein
LPKYSQGCYSLLRVSWLHHLQSCHNSSNTHFVALADFKVKSLFLCDFFVFTASKNIKVVRIKFDICTHFGILNHVKYIYVLIFQFFVVNTFKIFHVPFKNVKHIINT